MFETAAERLGLTLDRRLPAAARAGVRRPRPLGQGRAQPALERPEVHLRGRRSRCGCRRRRTAGAELTVTRHRHRHPRARAAAPLRALPPRHGRPVPHPRGVRHRPGAGLRARRACTAAGCSVRERARARARRSRCGCRSATRTCPPSRSPRRASEHVRGRRGGGRRASSPRRTHWIDAGRRRPRPAPRRRHRHRPAAGPRRRRQRRHPGVRRRAAAPRTTPCRPPSTASTGSSRPGRCRPTWC